MRHNKKFNHLGRTKAHRDAMLSNMATSLILHKRIFTTLAKAKALRVYVEPLINRAKEDTTASRRVVFRYLQSKEAVTELFKEISVKIADRPGGYTRILKTGNRLGDNAKTCFIELVDYNENMLKEKVAKKATRTRRSKKSAAPAAVTAEAPANEAPVSEAPATPAEEKFGHINGNKLYCFIYGKEKAPLSGAFSFLGERIEGIREYRFFYRFFVMVEKHFFCVLLYRRDCYVFIPYWLMIMPLFIGSQMFLNELAFCRWVKKGTENTIQFLFL